MWCVLGTHRINGQLLKVAQCLYEKGRHAPEYVERRANGLR